VQNRLKQKIGFIGLGTMGLPICYNLYKSGYRMILPTYRRRKVDKSNPLESDRTVHYLEMLENGCQSSLSSAELFAESDYIFICVPTSKQVEMNVYGAEGILDSAKPGTIVIDLTSAEPESTRKIAIDLAQKGIHFLDSPVSGGVTGASNHTLTIMVGGKKEVFDKIKPILEKIGDPNKISYVGPSGAGNTLKSINNFLSSTCLLASAEALTLATKADIDPKIAAKVIASGGGSSNATSFKFPDLIFTGKGMNMSVDMMLKDIKIFVDMAKDKKVPSFFGDTTFQLFGIQSSLGNGDTDFSNVVRMFEEWTGARLWNIDHE